MAEFSEQGGSSTMDPSRFRRYVTSRVMSKVIETKSLRRSRHRAEKKRKKNNLPHIVEYFHQLNDGYSHLTAQIISRLKSKYNIEIKCYLVSETDGANNPEPDLLAKYALEDSSQISRHFNLSFNFNKRPDRDVIKKASKIIANLTDDARTENLETISTLVWSNDIQALEKLSENLEIGDVNDEFAERFVQQGNERRSQLGHYSGAMFFYGDEWYWGVDRLYHLERRFLELDLVIDHTDNTLLAPQKTLKITKLSKNNNFALEFFPSLRSPYTAIVYDRVTQFCDECNLKLVMRPVLPMVMRGLPVTRKKGSYIFKDVAREARANGVSFGNFYDPIGKPVRDCYSLFGWAKKNNRSNELLSHFLSAAFAMGINLSRTSNMQYVVERAGLSWDEAKKIIGNKDWYDEIESNRKTIYADGLWGVPSFRLLKDKKTIYSAWGQDRLWVLSRILSEFS